MRTLLRGVSLATGLLLLATIAAAQEASIVVGEKPTTGPAPFGGKGATPISPTTVIQFNLEPRDSGGAKLAYVVVIRGPADWYRARTHWGPGDSLPGFAVEKWTVGAVRYSIAYSRDQHELRTFGGIFDLRASPIVLVNLGQPVDGAGTATAGPPLDFVLDEPGGFAALFLDAAPAVRAFAGLEP